MAGSNDIPGLKRIWFRFCKPVLIGFCALSIGACSNLEAETPVAEGDQVPVLQSDHVVMPDGTKLALTRTEPGGAPKAVILALHGFADYARNYALAAPEWAKAGYLVIAVDQRGFGRNESLGHWAGAPQMIDDLAHMILAVSDAYPDLRLHLVGASMGAAVITSVMGSDGYDEAKARVTSVALAAPATRGWRVLPFYFRAVLSGARRLGPDWSFSGDMVEVVTTDNIEWLRELSDDPYMMREGPVRSLYGMAWLMDGAIERAQGLTIPAFVAYGGKDEVIMADGLACYMARVPDGVRYRFYPDGYHLILRDKGRAPVIADIATFFDDAGAIAPLEGAPEGLPEPADHCTSGEKNG